VAACALRLLSAAARSGTTRWHVVPSGPAAMVSDAPRMRTRRPARRSPKPRRRGGRIVARPAITSSVSTISSGSIPGPESRTSSVTPVAAGRATSTTSPSAMWRTALSASARTSRASLSSSVTSGNSAGASRRQARPLARARGAEPAREGRGELLGDGAHAPHGRGAGDWPGHQATHLRAVAGLGAVVEGAQANPLYRGVERAVAGDDEDLQIGVELLGALEDADPAQARHLEIERHDVDRVPGDRVERRLAAAGGDHLALAVQDRAQRLPHTHLVVHDQHTGSEAHRGGL